MKNLIRQNVGNSIAIGINGDLKEQTAWSILIHNFSISNGSFFFHSEHFGYFLITCKKDRDGNIIQTADETFRRGMEAFFRAQLFINKRCSVDEFENSPNRYRRNGIRYRLHQQVKEFIASIPEEPFYTHLDSARPIMNEFTVAPLS